jgi:hypothetical protein
MDPLAFVALVIALLSAAVAGWGVVVARGANRIAQQALEVQQKALPATWSDVEKQGENLVAVRNQSGRHVVVQKVTVAPEEFVKMVMLRTELPTRVEYGDFFKFLVRRSLGGGPEVVSIFWTFEGETEEQITERRL